MSPPGPWSVSVDDDAAEPAAPPGHAGSVSAGPEAVLAAARAALASGRDADEADGAGRVWRRAGAPLGARPPAGQRALPPGRSSPPPGSA